MPLGRRLKVAAAVFVLGALATPIASAETDPDEATDLVDWYYAAAFGTGVYRIGERTVTVFRIPLSYELTSVLKQRGGLRLLLPVTLGFYDFDYTNIADFDFDQQFGTLSFLPGAEFDLPVLRNWLLIPHANLGLGAEAQGEDYAWIYSIGIKSRLRLPMDNSEFMLGNALTYAAYSANEGVDSSLSRFVTGLNYMTPLSVALFSRDAHVRLHFIHYYYFNELDFTLPGGDDEEISQEYELAVSLEGERPWTILGFEVERVGVALRYGDGLKAIRFVGGFPF